MGQELQERTARRQTKRGQRRARQRARRFHARMEIALRRMMWASYWRVVDAVALHGWPAGMWDEIGGPPDLATLMPKWRADGSMP